MIISKLVSPDEINGWIEQNKAFQLIDISNDNLLKRNGIEAVWIRETLLLDQLSLIRKNIPVVLCCKYGEASFILMNILHRQFDFDNVYSLKSGIAGWKPS
jgi:rhodanese-related sulfurtransferase